MRGAPGEVRVRVLSERLPRAGDLRRAAVEFLPAFVVAILLLPFIMKQGTLWPWQPNTIDLRVYFYAVDDLVHGRNIYETSTPGDQLKFIYPPISALLLTPLLLGPVWFWQAAWTALGVWAQQSVLRRFRVPRGVFLGLLGVVVVLVVEPIRTTLGYGQVNTMLMALVVADLLPDSPGERRRIPQGMLIGLAAAIKLTPLLFLAFAFAARRRATALVGAATFGALTLAGYFVLPGETVAFLASLGQGTVKTSGPIYVGNQSWTGVMTRFFVQDRTWVVVGILLGFAIAAVAVFVAAHWWRRGEQLFAVALVGMATVLASPLSWTHHHVWILPLLVAAALPSTLPRWAVWASRVWGVWVSACLVLSVLPYGRAIEGSYDPLQRLTSNFGPLLGSALILGLAAQFVLSRRARSRAEIPAVQA